MVIPIQLSDRLYLEYILLALAVCTKARRPSAESVVGLRTLLTTYPDLAHSRLSRMFKTLNMYICIQVRGGRC